MIREANDSRAAAAEPSRVIREANDSRAAAAEPSRVSDDRAALLECALSAKLVNRIAQVIAAQRSVSDLVRVAIEHTRALCDACGASRLLLDPSTQELCFDRV